MKTNWSHLDAWRKPHPITGYISPGDTVGCFCIPHHDARQWRKCLAHYIVIANDASNGGGWEHVSVHVRYRDGADRKMRTPTWDEMCWIKDQFWNPTEAVMQLHPPQREHINLHNHVLHLWRPTAADLPVPPREFV